MVCPDFLPHSVLELHRFSISQRPSITFPSDTLSVPAGTPPLVERFSCFFLLPQAVCRHNTLKSRVSKYYPLTSKLIGSPFFLPDLRSIPHEAFSAWPISYWFRRGPSRFGSTLIYLPRSAPIPWATLTFPPVCGCAFPSRTARWYRSPYLTSSSPQGSQINPYVARYLIFLIVGNERVCFFFMLVVAQVRTFFCSPYLPGRLRRIEYFFDLFSQVFFRSSTWSYLIENAHLHFLPQPSTNRPPSSPTCPDFAPLGKQPFLFHPRW